MTAVILMANGFESWEAVLWGSLAQGIVTTVSPALVQPFMRKATKQENVALGHTGNFGIATSGWVAKLTKGDARKSTEDLKIPSGLGFLRDTTVVIALSMGVIYLLVTLIAGPGYVESELSGGQWFLIWAIMQAGMFAAGVTIILAGVRVVLAEIIPASRASRRSWCRTPSPPWTCRSSSPSRRTPC